MMTEGQLPFQYLPEKNGSGLTSFAGLPLYIDMAMTTGLCTVIVEQLQSKSQGWSDLQIILSLILLNLTGGDCVDDIERLEHDEGMRTLMLKLQTHGMHRKARRDYERRWRKSNERAFPSASAIHRYLEQFHHAPEEKRREKGKAFILAKKMATLDQDATLCERNKSNAYFCYQKYKAYQPFNTYWSEPGLFSQ